MRFRTPPIFEYLFWFGALCLSPLILCYFILAGLQKLIAAILRLWIYPTSNSIQEPFDPDVEDTAGAWPAQKGIDQVTEDLATAKFTNPTIDQVMDVKRMFSELKFTKLWEFDENGVRTSSSINTRIPWALQSPRKEPIRVPPEVCDMILDLAEYWPCTKTVVSRVMLIGQPHGEMTSSVWMDKERDWKANTPGASKRTQPWRRTSSLKLGRTLEDEPSNHEHGVYLRTFPLGGSLDLVAPEMFKTNSKGKEKSTKSALAETQSRWRRLFGMLDPSQLKDSIGGMELKKTEKWQMTAGTLTTTDGLRRYEKAIVSRSLFPSELESWNLEINELYPNVKPDLSPKKFEKKETKRTKRQWRSFYMMSCFRRYVVPIYSFYTTTREEKFRIESQIASTDEKPFRHRNILEPRLFTCVAGFQNNDRARRAAKVRKIVWTIWTKEVQDKASYSNSNPVDSSAYPEMTWFEMFIEEPVPKSAGDPEIVWRKRYPKGKENILVQRDLSHRIRLLTGPRIRVHKTVWDWNDWEDISVDMRMNDSLEDEGPWRFHCDILDIIPQAGQPHSHPEYHDHPKNFCNCAFGKKLFWGEGVPPGKTSPVSTRVRALDTFSSSSKSSRSSSSTSSSSSSSSSGSSSSSSSNSSASSSSSSSANSENSSTNSSSNDISPTSRSGASTVILPNTVLEERVKTGSLKKNGAVGKLVRNMRMGDRLVLVGRSGGGLPSTRRSQGWDVGIYRAEVDVYWAV